ncbi:MAG: hypothetical protein IT335_04890 [Thermomicrobiales bacterium]|nr:hypothetical protein [Thermomicrobiales bacterium]
MILGLLELEYELYKEEEIRVNTALLGDIIREALHGTPIGREGVGDFAKELFPRLNEFFSSLAQSRKSRAGISFETHTRFLFRHLNYPFDEQRVINGRPDFILPNADLYRTSPDDVVLLTVKRTLRERWRQIIPEGVKTSRYFLATIDTALTSETLAEMANHRVVLVMPQPKIDEVPAYAASDRVISFATLFEDHIEPALIRWRRRGLIV